MADRAVVVEGVYAAMGRGDFDPLAGVVAEGARWHVPGLGVELEGRARVLEWVRELYERGFAPRVEHVAGYGDAVVAWVEGALPGGEAFRACYVHRFSGDEIAEFTSVRL